MDEEQEKKTLNETAETPEVTEPEPKAEAESVSEPKTESESKAEPESESKPESKSELTKHDAKKVEKEKHDKKQAELDRAFKSKESTAKPECCKKHNNANIAIFLSIIAIICSTVSIIYAYRNPSGNSIISFGADGNSANFTEGSVADIANKVSPSVVSITTETRQQSYYGQTTSTAAGTGFIISSDGYVLTNKHVVEDANQVSVVLDDGTIYKDVKVIGTDPLNDAAIIKINNAKDLPAVTLGDSKTINVGQSVIAIGNALGQYQNTVTQGIISGTGRSIVAGDSSGSAYESLNDMIQTDAAINQGNSGGPLVNAAGQVVGINTAVTSSTTGTGFGFAIPISSVKGIVKSVLETGELKRAYIGVYYTSLTPQNASDYKLSRTSGAYIHATKGDAVVKDSAAAKAGLQDGDIIIAVNGTEIGKNGSLGSLLGEYTVGDTITLSVLKGGSGEVQKVNVTLEEYKTSK